jgi:hypothetical protein
MFRVSHHQIVTRIITSSFGYLIVIFYIRWEPKSPCQRAHWTQRVWCTHKYILDKVCLGYCPWSLVASSTWMCFRHQVEKGSYTGGPVRRCSQLLDLVYFKITPSISGLKKSLRGTWWRSWLRHYATSRKVAGSTPDEVDFFNWPNPSSRTMALG